MIDSRVKNNKLSELKLKDISGKIFGKLTVIKKHEKRSHNNKILWECLCECGNKCIIAGNQLNRVSKGGNGIPTRSCGCLRNNAHNKIKDREGGAILINTVNNLTLYKNQFENCSAGCNKFLN